MQKQQQQDPQVQCAIKFTQSFLDRVDKLAAAMSKPALRMTRSDVLRLAAYDGMDRLEAAEQKKTKR